MQPVPRADAVQAPADAAAVVGAAVMGAAAAGTSVPPAGAAGGAVAPPMFDEPPPFGSKDEAALYTPSAPWLTDVFLQSTEAERE